MSETARCETIAYIGQIKRTSSAATTPLRASCDRPLGHSADTHRGRLTLGTTVWGIVTWPMVVTWPVVGR